MSWLQKVFAVERPVIGMCHLVALPGDPHYDQTAGMDGVVERARREIRGLQEGGVDGILVSNEFSLPYLTKTAPITSASMARVVGELSSEISKPFGVNVLWDGHASIDVAVATGARFVREVFTGAYASDFGLWNTNVGAAARHRHDIGGDDIRLLFNIVPEAASYLAPRGLEDVARSTVFNALPDGLCVSGLTAGAATEMTDVEAVKKMSGSTPVLVNTGVNDQNVGEVLSVGDGAIVGTHFKREGRFENSVDPHRVENLMRRAREARE